MARFLVISGNEQIYGSLENRMNHIHGFSSDSIINLSYIVPEAVHRGELGRDHSPLQVFLQISDEISAHVDDEGQSIMDPALPNFTAFIDLYDSSLLDFTYLDPLDRNAGWSSVVAMLILAHPEIQWCFMSSREFRLEPDEHRSEDASLDSGSDYFWYPVQTGPQNWETYSVLDHFRKCPSPLFDPLGLRNSIRGQIKEDLPLRSSTAAVIDDEPAYSYLNGYAAYRFGYRTWGATSWEITERLFGEEMGDADAPFVDLLLEDLYCRFPDRPENLFSDRDELEDPSFSNLCDRDKKLSVLKEMEGLRRVVVTVGHEQHEEGKQKENRRYLHRWSNDADGREALFVEKPLNGIFDLWKEAGMWWEDFWGRKGHPKTARDFDWFDQTEQIPGQDSSNEPHSAPGRLLVIAQRMLERSRNILRGAQSVPGAIFAATLALEAKELLANRTPTTALEALTLQHRAEIQAESMFHGIEFNLDVKSRFDEIRREVEAIGRWFSGRKRKRVRVTLNARLAIIEDLARKFSELDQFEEERKCRAEARRLYFDLWTYRRPWRFPFRYPLRYLSLSLRSLPVFFGLVAFWIVLFGVAYNVVDPYVFGESRSLGEAFSTSTVYFFTLQMPDPDWYRASRQVLWNSILTFQSAVSLSHLGILVSHIYLIVSRR